MAEQPGIEIVERRGDGKWYSNLRSFNPSEYESLRQWVVASRPSGRYAWRYVQRGEEFLSASESSTQQVSSRTGTSKTMGMMTEDKARGNGYRLATALCQAFTINPNAPDGAWYALARSFAAMSDDYEGRDESDALIDGFREGWQTARPKLLGSGAVTNGNAE